MHDVENRAKNPRGRLIAIFDTLNEWFTSRDFSGCLFVNAAAEFPKADCPIHNTCAENKRLLVNYIIDLAEKADATDAKSLGQGLMLLMEGAVAMYYVGFQKDAALQAKKSAQMLLTASGL